MKLAKTAAVVMVVFGTLVPVQVSLASEGGGNLDKTKVANPDKDKDKDKKDKKNDPVSVPEPATLALLGAAAGVAGARKLWRNRRRSGSS